MNNKETMEKQNKGIKFPTIIYAVIIILLAYLAAIGILIYAFGADNKMTRKTARFFPYPAAVINATNFVTVGKLTENLDSIRRFYENQDFSDSGLRVDFATPDGKKRLKIKEKNLLNKMVEDKIIEMLARKRNVKVTPEVVSQEVNRKIEEYGSREEVIANLSKLYGWKISDFEEKIVKPDIYREAVRKDIKETDAASVTARSKIEEALSAIQSGKDFGEIAQKYSEGESAKNKGELGWFSADQMVPEVAVVAFVTEKGGQSGVIESALGYHIIQVEDRKTEEGVEKVKIKQVFVRTKNFADWLQEQKKTIKIYLPLKDLYWDRGKGSVEFSDKELKEFEENLDQNSAGDISVLF